MEDHFILSAMHSGHDSGGRRRGDNKANGGDESDNGGEAHCECYVLLVWVKGPERLRVRLGSNGSSFIAFQLYAGVRFDQHGL